MARLSHGDAQLFYHERRRSMMEAVGLVQRRDMIAVPIATGQPAAFLQALGERDDWQELTIFSGILIEPYNVFLKPGVRLISGFYGPLERMMKAAGARIQYLPADFLGYERFAKQMKPRVVASAVSAMDEHGFLNFSLHAGATFNAFLDAARDPDRIAIAEVTPTLPRVLGLGRYGGNRIHISEVDCVVESDRAAFVYPGQDVTDEDEAIARHVESQVENGATLQIGIGGIPNIVAGLLAKGKKGDFGIHTEMFVDGIMDLHRAGKVSNNKGIYDGFSVATFAAGSADLYRWIDSNPEVRMLPVGLVNDPAIIRQNRNMVSINSALGIDLSGQVMADTIGPRQYSGVGGHELFVIGAHDSPGGKSFICLHATRRVEGELVSNILPSLPLGTPVSTPRHHVQYIVTEFGAANIGMLPDDERAAALIQVAHPKFHDELRAEIKRRWG